jgi:hypothetical protein
MVGTQPKARFLEVRKPWTERLWEKGYKNLTNARKEKNSDRLLDNETGK